MSELSRTDGRKKVQWSEFLTNYRVVQRISTLQAEYDASELKMERKKAKFEQLKAEKRLTAAQLLDGPAGIPSSEESEDSEYVLSGDDDDDLPLPPPRGPRKGTVPVSSTRLSDEEPLPRASRHSISSGFRQRLTTGSADTDAIMAAAAKFGVLQPMDGSNDDSSVMSSDKKPYVTALLDSDSASPSPPVPKRRVKAPSVEAAAPPSRRKVKEESPSVSPTRSVRAQKGTPQPPSYQELEDEVLTEASFAEVYSPELAGSEVGRSPSPMGKGSEGKARSESGVSWATVEAVVHPPLSPVLSRESGSKADVVEAPEQTTPGKAEDWSAPPDASKTFVYGDVEKVQQGSGAVSVPAEGPLYSNRSGGSDHRHVLYVLTGI